ncbi:MAG: site-2 protease family protein [Desulfosudaceae bacterium]
MLEQIDINRIVVMLLPLLFAVSLHETAHGFAALKMGDDTAARAGRLTLNPIRHLDPIGSVVLPLLLAVSGAPFIIGYAKPVPVNFARLTDWKKGTIWVSVAGVLANLGCLAVSGILFRLLYQLVGDYEFTSSLAYFITRDLLLILGFSVLINAILAVFNMIPIPPLDGSKIVLVFLPPRLRKQFASIERVGIILILLLLIVKADWLFTIIWFLIMPLLYLALGEQGLAFIANM